MSLKSDPQKTAEWQRRSQERAAQNAKQRAPLKRTGAPEREAAIRKVSGRRKAQNVEYSRRRMTFLTANPLCMRCKVQGREVDATDIHHRCGRNGERLNDESAWASLCRGCHDFCHMHPREAQAEGYSMSRIAKEVSNGQD